MLNTMQLMRYWIADREISNKAQSQFTPQSVYAYSMQEQEAFDRAMTRDASEALNASPAEDDSEFVVSLN